MTSQLNRRELLGASLAFGATLPFLHPGRAFAQENDLVLKSTHPELRPVAARLLEQVPYPRLDASNLAAARQAPTPYLVPGGKVPVKKQRISGSKGQPDVVVHVVNAKPGSRRPAILHTHGGGYVIGTAESVIGELEAICLALDCVAVTVDYRLAPETTYAGSIEDNYAALKWLHRHAEEIGGDPARIALLGESAGAGHAALLAIAARDRGEVPVAYQCLVYPMLDDRTGTTRPVPPHIGRLIWSADSNRFGWASFLGVQPGGETAPSGAVPARVEGLKGLPPTFIGVGTVDLFFDEDVDYAQRLNAAAVPVDLVVVPGAFHGFDLLARQTPVAREFNTAKLDALRRGLGLAVESR